MDLKTMEDFKALKPTPIGKRPEPRGNLQEMEAIKAFFAERNIPRNRIAKQLGVTFTSVFRWWRGDITQMRLEQLKELANQIAKAEEINGNIFGG
jgi:predicted XRE-type DNA-binding protein